VGDGMPYHVEKGPTWQTFDDYFSDDERIRHKLYVLASLWTQRRFTAFQDQFELPGRVLPGAQPFVGLVRHANVDWFGLPLNDPNHPERSSSYGDWVACSTHNPPQATGMWKTWCGNAEQIVRVTMIRAIEVSLGLDHPTPSAAYDPIAGPPLDASRVPATDVLSFLYGTHVDPNNVPYAPNLADAKSLPLAQLTARFERNWPIEHWWVCGVRYFQASITWRRERRRAADVATSVAENPDVVSPQRTGAEDAGRVVVVFVTPGSTHHHVFDDLEHVPMNVTPPLGSPPAPAPSAKELGAPWVLDPRHAGSRFGSWIVGHRHHALVDVPSHLPTKPGYCPCPIKFSVQSGRVMAVQPVYEDGGVRADSSSY